MNISNALLPSLAVTVNRLVGTFDEITPSRKVLLKKLSVYIQQKVDAKEEVFLNFICTHNSRRSHISQLWAQTAAHYYGINDVTCFSGGTEATAFNPRAVKAMQDAGFEIQQVKEGVNPVYDVRYADDGTVIHAFSKKYDDPMNPSQHFAAIMTCSHADENCPVIRGADDRIVIDYTDPKASDETPDESQAYGESVYLIGREMLYVFAGVASKR